MYTITDPTAARDGFEFLDQDVVQLEGKAFHVQRIVLKLGKGAVVFHHVNQRLRSRTKIPSGLMAVAVFKPSVRATLNGRPIHPDFLVAAEPGSEGEFVVEPGYESASFLFPPEDLAEHLRRRGRETEFRAPHGIEFWHAGDLAVRGLFDLGKGLSKTGARTPALFDEHEQARLAAHVEVFDKLVTTLGLIEDKQPTKRDRTSISYSKIVQAAEDHALEHVSQRMYVTELCEVTRVSERTLQTAFQAILGMTPMNYIRQLRLHRLRQALRTARYGSTTVSFEALNWGFWHFGDLSREYKKSFGESPSQTLRQGL